MEVVCPYKPVTVLGMYDHFGPAVSYMLTEQKVQSSVLTGNPGCTLKKYSLREALKALSIHRKSNQKSHQTPMTQQSKPSDPNATATTTR
ncbi:hypothetical protein TNCV_2269611 [Trichonephila clavipes]|nr:hypothetical protein TNCV_2269611 [Trichonephila clavipes]